VSIFIWVMVAVALRHFSVLTRVGFHGGIPAALVARGWREDGAATATAQCDQPPESSALASHRCVSARAAMVPATLPRAAASTALGARGGHAWAGPRLNGAR
jgi:hypothetical protein